MTKVRYTTTVAVFLLLTTFLLSAQSGDAVSRKARQLHFSSIVLDTHIDTTLRLARSNWKFTEEHPPMAPGIPSRPQAQGQAGHSDLPRIKKGGLGALFFGVVVPGSVTGPAAVERALVQIAAVHKLAEDLPGDVAFCVTAEQVRTARRQGRIAALIGLEGGHMIDNSLPVLRMYSKLGVSYITLAHFYNTDWADSSGQPAQHNGLTSLGKEIVLEMNRLGMMVDISHVSDKTFTDTLAVSRAPLIASHSSSRALAGHVRNMSDDMIRALADKGGVIHINYHTPYLDEARAQHWNKSQTLMNELTEKFPGEDNEALRQAEVAKQFGPAPPVRWEKILDHIDHVVKLAGADHVGLGSDFDGAIMPAGMEDVSHLPKLTEGLLRRGYKESDIRKILGENTLRVMAEVQKISERLRRER